MISPEREAIGFEASYPGGHDVSVDVLRYTFKWYTLIWGTGGVVQTSPERHDSVFEVIDGVPAVVEEEGPPLPSPFPFMVGAEKEQCSFVLRWWGPGCDNRIRYAGSLEEPQWKEVEGG